MLLPLHVDCFHPFLLTECRPQQSTFSLPHRILLLVLLSKYFRGVSRLILPTDFCIFKLVKNLVFIKLETQLGRLVNLMKLEKIADYNSTFCQFFPEEHDTENTEKLFDTQDYVSRDKQGWLSWAAITGRGKQGWWSWAGRAAAVHARKRDVSSRGRRLGA